MKITASPCADASLDRTAVAARLPNHALPSGANIAAAASATCSAGGLMPPVIGRKHPAAAQRSRRSESRHSMPPALATQTPSAAAAEIKAYCTQLPYRHRARHRHDVLAAAAERRYLLAARRAPARAGAYLEARSRNWQRCYCR